MRIKLLLLTIFSAFSLNLAAQVTLTHALVKFTPGADEALISRTLGNINGLHTYDKSYHIKNPDVVILPITSSFDNVKQQLIANQSVAYVAPVYSNNREQMVTYTDELFVKVKNQNSLAELKRLASAHNAAIIGETGFLKGVYKLKVTQNDIDTRELANTLQKTGLFEYAEANYFFTVAVTSEPDNEPNDPLFIRQWNLLNTGIPQQWNGDEGVDMNVLEAWKTTMGSPDIKVAILDSGVDTLHEDLAANMLPGYDALGEGLRGYPEPNFDQDGHGTCCAGIVAAVANNGIGIAGVAPQCKIIPVRVFSYITLGNGGTPQPWSTGEWFADGITWAWQYGQADVASNSWGIPDGLLDFIDPDKEQVAVVNEALLKAFSHGRKGLGTPYLFSSGNDGLTDTIPIWPARMPETIAVNASSMCDEAKSDTSCDNEGWWAGNWGTGVDISAPGVKIPATDMTGSDGYKPSEYYYTFNGTSSACPNAAGVMALILSVNPELTYAAAREIISTTADKVGGYEYKEGELSSWSKELGYGRVNALSAVQAATTWVIPKQAGYIYNDQSSGANYLHTFSETPVDVYLDVYDVMGNMVKSIPTSSQIGHSDILINDRELRTGIYIAIVNVNGVESTFKFFATRAK